MKENCCQVLVCCQSLRRHQDQLRYSWSPLSRIQTRTMFELQMPLWEGLWPPAEMLVGLPKCDLVGVFLYSEDRKGEMGDKCLFIYLAHKWRRTCKCYVVRLFPGPHGSLLSGWSSQCVQWDKKVWVILEVYKWNSFVGWLKLYGVRSPVAGWAETNSDVETNF